MQKTSSSEQIKQTSHISEKLYFILSVKHGKCEEKNQTIKLCINLTLEIRLFFYASECNYVYYVGGLSIKLKLLFFQHAEIRFLMSVLMRKSLPFF